MDCSSLPFSAAELLIFRSALVAGVVTVATMSSAFSARLLYKWLRWHR